MIRAQLQLITFFHQLHIHLNIGKKIKLSHSRRTILGSVQAQMDSEIDTQFQVSRFPSSKLLLLIQTLSSKNSQLTSSTQLVFHLTTQINTRMTQELQLQLVILSLNSTSTPQLKNNGKLYSVNTVLLLVLLKVTTGMSNHGCPTRTSQMA